MVAATYYLRLDGKNEDSQWVAEADGINGTAYAITSNGTPYIVDYDSRLYVDLYEEDGDLYLSIYAPKTPEQRKLITTLSFWEFRRTTPCAGRWQYPRKQSRPNLLTINLYEE